VEHPKNERPAVAKVMSLLSAFGDDAYKGVGVSELSRRTELSKSTVHRLLGDLAEAGAVDKSGNTYRLGRMLPRIVKTRETAMHGYLLDALTPSLTELYEVSRQTVHLAVLLGTEVLYLSKLYGQSHTKIRSRVGGLAPAHSTALGKVLIAFQPEITEEIVQAGLRRFTPNTISSGPELQLELGRVRDTGIAHDNEETALALRCIGVPVIAPGGNTVAAISISMTNRNVNLRATTVPLRAAGKEAAKSLIALRSVFRDQMTY
jgi:DNA-binding IclR family transcriptional regulator